jgi:secreted trypsin-like serine protease
MTRSRRRALTLLAGVLAAGACAAPAGAVVNGTPADVAQTPWFATVGGCGGTLVAPDRVLTAAHCVAGSNLGDERSNYVSVGTVGRRATHYALHPNWRERNGSNFADDVAIVALDQPVTGVPTVALGGAAPRTAHILGHGRPYAPGTGHSEKETLDSTLRTADLKLIGDDACAATFGKGYRSGTGERFLARQLCAIDADGKEPLYSGCNGDSGGPLWTGAADAPVQLGVVSWGGDRCGADHLPSVFADVARYRGFITAARPTWAPIATTRSVTPTGTPRAGHKLTCSVDGFHTDVPAEREYAWVQVGGGSDHYGAPKSIGSGKTYKVKSSDAGKTLGCIVKATNDGGYSDAGAGSVRIKSR